MSIETGSPLLPPEGIELGSFAGMPEYLAAITLVVHDSDRPAHCFAMDDYGRAVRETPRDLHGNLLRGENNQPLEKEKTTRWAAEHRDGEIFCCVEDPATGNFYTVVTIPRHYDDPEAPRGLGSLGCTVVAFLRDAPPGQQVTVGESFMGETYDGTLRVGIRAPLRDGWYQRSQCITVPFVPIIGEPDPHAQFSIVTFNEENERTVQLTINHAAELQQVLRQEALRAHPRPEYVNGEGYPAATDATDIANWLAINSHPNAATATPELTAQWRAWKASLPTKEQIDERNFINAKNRLEKWEKEEFFRRKRAAQNAGAEVIPFPATENNTDGLASAA